MYVYQDPQVAGQIIDAVSQNRADRLDVAQIANGFGIAPWSRQHFWKKWGVADDLRGPAVGQIDCLVMGQSVDFNSREVDPDDQQQRTDAEQKRVCQKTRCFLGFQNLKQSPYSW